MKSLQDIINQLKERLGSPVNLDQLIAQTEIITINKKKYVRKKFSSEIGFLKWLPPSIVFRSSYPFAMNARERLLREVSFFKAKIWSYVQVPNVIAVDEDNLVIIREFVEGSYLDYKKEGKSLGRILGEIHKKGYVMGDVKPTNFILNNRPYIIDAEQAVQNTDPALRSWDLILTIFFASFSFLMDRKSFRNFLTQFLNEYLNSGGDAEAVAEMLTLKNSGIAMIIPLPHLVIAAEIIEQLIG